MTLPWFLGKLRALTSELVSILASSREDGLSESLRTILTMHHGAGSNVRGLEESLSKVINQADAVKRWQRKPLAAALTRAPATGI